MDGLRDRRLRRTYEELVARGVEFSHEPTAQSYGIDCALRVPFGNHIRILQRTANSGVGGRFVLNRPRPASRRAALGSGAPPRSAGGSARR